MGELNDFCGRMRTIFALLTLFLITQITFAQRPEKRGGVEEADLFAIEGVVIDPDNEPLPYAAVSVYNAADSSMVKGTATDMNGAFSIPVKSGKYYVKIAFLSFMEKIIPNVEVVNSSKDLGRIFLRASDQVMEEVVVQAEKSTVELKLDKRVFNVGKDLSSSGSNASQILENVPSVSVDVDGNVSLRGSQNVRILIDGKPSGLVGTGSTDALRQLQGSLVESVEVITNPSARYEAEGEVGIINIVLKKERRDGVNGSFEVFGGHPANYGGSYNLNYRKKWVNLFSSVGVGYQKRPGWGSQYQTFDNGDTSYVFETNREHERGGLSGNARIGSDFFLNDKNTITVSGLYKYSDGNNFANLVYKDFDVDGNLTGETTRRDDESEVQYDIEANISYRKTFTKKGRLWTVDAKFIDSDDTEKSNITELSDTSEVPLLQRTSNTEDERNYLFQTDYIHPFGKDGKIEMGLRSAFRVIENDYSVEQDDGDGTFTILDNFNNFFIYNENIHAAYLMAGNKTGKLSYQGGLRAEFSDIKTELVKTGEVNPRQYLGFFPSAHFSYELPKANTIQVSYSRRLSRPRFRELLPFYGFSDSRSFWGGNPNLNPEYTNSFELGHLKYWENASLLSSVYYRLRTDVVERIRVADSTGFATTIPVNLSEQNAIGIEFNFSWDIANWWKLSGNVNFYQAITDGVYEGQNLHSETYSSVSRASSKFKAGKYDIQISGNYEAPENTTQGVRKSQYSIDAGITRDILKGNGTVTLSARDVFNTRRRRFVFETPTLYTEGEFQWRARQITLSFIYRLNQKKDRRNSGGLEGGGGEDGF